VKIRKPAIGMEVAYYQQILWNARW